MTDVRSIADLSSFSLIWTPVGRQSYQLAAGHDLVATLDWVKRSGSLARGEAADGTWSFKRVGFFRPYITVRDADSDIDLAALRSWKRRESVLEFADGRRFVWRPTRARRRQMAFVNVADETLLTMLPRTKLFKRFAEVEIQPGMEGLREQSLLALLGWYRMVLEFEDEELATVAVITAAT
jgi:hypothetical protein